MARPHLTSRRDSPSNAESVFSPTRVAAPIPFSRDWARFAPQRLARRRLSSDDPVHMARHGCRPASRQSVPRTAPARRAPYRRRRPERTALYPACSHGSTTPPVLAPRARGPPDLDAKGSCAFAFDQSPSWDPGRAASSDPGFHFDQTLNLINHPSAPPRCCGAWCSPFAPRLLAAATFVPREALRRRRQPRPGRFRLRKRSIPSPGLPHTDHGRFPSATKARALAHSP